MTNLARIPGEEAATTRRASPPENDPVLLALPPRPVENSMAAETESGTPCLEQLQVIETAYGPKVDAALLREILARDLGLGQSLADPAEVSTYQNPLAAVNAYKHRLHALRCEYASAGRRIQDLETQLERMHVLEKHIHFLEATLEQMRSSRGWKLVEICSRWRRKLVAGVTKLAAPARVGR